MKKLEIKEEFSMANIKLGYAPTRRSIFSAPDAIKYRGLTADRLTELGIDFVDITDINNEGLLYGDDEVSWDRWMKDRNRTEEDFVIPSAVCLLQVKFFADSAFHLHI